MPPLIDEYESIISSGKYVYVLRTSSASLGNLSQRTFVSRQFLLIRMGKTGKSQNNSDSTPPTRHRASASHSFKPENPLLKHHSV